MGQADGFGGKHENFVHTGKQLAGVSNASTFPSRGDRDLGQV